MISKVVLESKELVASSNIKIFGFLYKALAIPILCFCPPEIFLPLSPILVLIPLLEFLINASNLRF